VLGTSGSFPGANRACSGYVVETPSTRVVVDLGWGTAVRLFAVLGNHTGDGLAAVVITHEHPDHMADLYALFRARWYMRRNHPPTPLVAPPGVVDRLALTHDGERHELLSVFDWHPPQDAPIRVGDLEIRTWQLPHFVPNLGVRITSQDGVVAFTGDTGPSDDATTVGRDADLFVVDATDRHQQPGVEPAAPGSPAYNLTAAEAGALARDAGAATLLLIHLWPGNDPDLSRREAAAHFTGHVIVAQDGMILDVTRQGR
jgi:ribonuclease BN (tRNA processing enzyme)